MPRPMRSLLDEVSREHFPHPPATPQQIEEFERKMGWKLDPDLRAFYLHCNGAELFKLIATTRPSQIRLTASRSRALSPIRSEALRHLGS
jgi:hypothetical protein